MSSVEEKKFLKLLKFSEEISAMVVRSFIKSNILIDFEKSFGKFLDLYKHSIFHLWSNSTACCECSAFIRKDDRCLQEEQLKKLYTLGTDITHGHSIVIGNTVEQYCTCDVRVNGQCSLDKLDTALTYTLMKNCVSLSPAEETWLTTANEIYNTLTKTESMSFDHSSLDKWWTMLEGSVLGLASKVPPSFFEESVKKSIDLMKLSDIDICYVEERRLKINADNEKSRSIRKQQRDAVEEEENENVQQAKVLKTVGKTIETDYTDGDCFIECQMCHSSFCCNKCKRSLEKIKIIEKQYLKSCHQIEALKKQDENNRQTIAQLEKQNNVKGEKIKTIDKQCELEREKIQTMSYLRNRKSNIITKFFDNFEETKREYDKVEEQEEHLFEEQQKKKARFDVDEDDNIRRGPELKGKRVEKEVDEGAVCDVCKYACYGVEDIPEGDWFCKTCEAGVKPKCALCPLSGGAMKMTSDGTQWVHVSCAWWIPGVKFGNPNEMALIVDIDKIPEDRWSLICSLCQKKDGACIQCTVKNCAQSFHVTCAYLHGLKMDASCSEDNPNPVFKAYCETHGNDSKH